MATRPEDRKEDAIETECAEPETRPQIPYLNPP
jgi:hypothetical protein